MTTKKIRKKDKKNKSVKNLNFNLRKTGFKIDLSNEGVNQLVNSKNIPNNLYLKKLLFKLPSKDQEINVNWDFYNLRKRILDVISPKIYGWYHESTSSCGTSTFDAINAFLKIKIIPDYLNPNKEVSLNKNVILNSNELGITKFECKVPFFTAPYGCASEYGGKSNEINTMLGTINGGGIYTFASFTEYNLEYLVDILMKNNKQQVPFFMFQLYLTGDNDINISLIERAKKCGVSVLLITIDTGQNNHGGLGLLENQADLTFGKKFCGNLLYDPVFNIKCYKEKKCVGTKDKDVLSIVSKNLNISLEKLLASYNSQDSFDYAKVIQGEGMGRFNVLKNEKDKDYDLSIYNISKICHSSKSLCKFVDRNITKGIPLVVKGCMNVENALEIQKANADGVYVSNHGGRFLYNSIPPLDMLPLIRNAVKKVNNNFGVWFDGGIRCGSDIFTAFTQGAEFVGVGRPIIYSCVLHGEKGVTAITKKLIFELQSQCVVCGQNNLDNYKKLQKNI